MIDEIRKDMKEMLSNAFSNQHDCTYGNGDYALAAIKNKEAIDKIMAKINLLIGIESSIRKSTVDALVSGKSIVKVNPDGTVESIDLGNLGIQYGKKSDK